MKLSQSSITTLTQFACGPENEKYRFCLRVAQTTMDDVWEHLEQTRVKDMASHLATQLWEHGYKNTHVAMITDSYDYDTKKAVGICTDAVKTRTESQRTNLALMVVDDMAELFGRISQSWWYRLGRFLHVIPSVW